MSSQLTRSGAVMRRRPSRGEPYGSSSRKTSPIKATALQQNAHHFDQLLHGSSLRESISGSPSAPSSRQEDIPREGNPGGGSGVRRNTAASRSGPGNPNRSTKRGIPGLRLQIPKDPPSRTPIELKIESEPPQKMTRGCAGSKRAEVPFPCEDKNGLTDQNTKFKENKVESTKPREEEEGGSAWGRVAARVARRDTGLRERQTANSRYEWDTPAALHKNSEVTKPGIRSFFQHNKPDKESRLRLLSGSDD